MYCCAYNKIDSTCTNCDANYETYNGKYYLEIDNCCEYNETDLTCTSCDTDYQEYNDKCYLEIDH